ncbi:MAG: hypothetical protein JXA60_10235 [Candidatus Coatesbacteria bacterium]|nr:hypothetical protein [Candidatus Coatesbacteria bacterium]
MLKPENFNGFCSDLLEEINRHKWIMSENQHQDVGFEAAFRDWIETESQKWLATKLQSLNTAPVKTGVKVVKNSTKAKPVKKVKKKTETT